MPPPDWRPPVIAVNANAGQPIQLRAASVEVDLFGDQARTSVELRLFNPNHRVLEGELQFPLQEGQVVTGFALDVNGRLRDAAPVPKAKGQEIFEDIRRRRVDPGLLEAAAGNQYKLRVYPIPAMGERRVVITFTETLARQRMPACCACRWPSRPVWGSCSSRCAPMAPPARMCNCCRPPQVPNWPPTPPARN